MSEEYMNNINLHVHHSPLKVQRTINVNGFPTTVCIFIQFSEAQIPDSGVRHNFIWILLPRKLLLFVKMSRERTRSFTIFHSFTITFEQPKIYYYHYCHVFQANWTHIRAQNLNNKYIVPQPHVLFIYLFIHSDDEMKWLGLHAAEDIADEIWKKRTQCHTMAIYRRFSILFAFIFIRI